MFSDGREGRVLLWHTQGPGCDPQPYTIPVVPLGKRRQESLRFRVILDYKRGPRLDRHSKASRSDIPTAFMSRVFPWLLFLPCPQGPKAKRGDYGSALPPNSHELAVTALTCCLGYVQMLNLEKRRG